MTTKHKTVYVLTENVAYEGSTVLDIYSDKMDALAAVHDTAREKQTGHYEDYDISYWSNDSGSESVQPNDITWTVAPTEVQ